MNRRIPAVLPCLVVLIASACLAWPLVSLAAGTETPAKGESKPVAKTAPPASQLLAMDSGRRNRDLVMTTGVRGFTKPPAESMHALIMIAGAYQNGIQQLKGVYEDGKSAAEIAERMGVPRSNLTTLIDQQLTHEGMRRAFIDLGERVKPGDDVFIYYSGHGGRSMVQEDGVQRCAESLLAIDGYGYMDKEMSAQMKLLSQKAKKVVMFIDACHSGGVTTRGMQSTAPAGWVAKSGNAADVCAVPTNVLKRSLTSGQSVPGSGAANFVYIAAARDNERAFDQPGKGGLATQAWLRCMRGQAVDKDGSGGISAEELAACAQTNIEQTLKDAEFERPHHITLNGNRNLVLTYLEKEPPVAESSAAPVSASASAPVSAAATVAAAVSTPPSYAAVEGAVSTAMPAAAVISPEPLPSAAPPAVALAATEAVPPSAPAPVVEVPVAVTPPVAPIVWIDVPATGQAAQSKPPAPAYVAVAPNTVAEAVAPTPVAAPAMAAAVTPAVAPVPAVVKLAPSATLKDIYENRDDRRQVILSAAKTRMKIDADPLDLTVQVREGGYLYLLMVGSDGETFDILFPNQIDKKNKVADGETLRLPRTGWNVTASGPVGSDTILALVTDAPRDFSALGLTKAGPFSVAQATTKTAMDMQLLSSGALLANSMPCQTSRKRNLSIQAECSNSYGAAILTIEEVQ